MPNQLPRKIPPEKPIWTDWWDNKYNLAPQPGFLTGYRFQEFTSTKSAPGDQNNALKLCMEDIRSQPVNWTNGWGNNAIVVVDHETAPDPTMEVTIIVSQYRVEISAFNDPALWPFVHTATVDLDWVGADEQYPLSFRAGFGYNFEAIDYQALFVNIVPPWPYEDIIILTIDTNWLDIDWVVGGGVVQEIYVEPQITVDMVYQEIYSQEDFDYFYDEDAEELDAVIEQDEEVYAEVSSPVFPLIREE